MPVASLGLDRLCDGRLQRRVSLIMLALRQMQIGDMAVTREILRVIGNRLLGPGECALPVTAAHQDIAEPPLVVTARRAEAGGAPERGLGCGEIAAHQREIGFEIVIGRILRRDLPRPLGPDLRAADIAARHAEFRHAAERRRAPGRLFDPGQDRLFRAVEIAVALLKAGEDVMAVEVIRPSEAARRASATASSPRPRWAMMSASRRR